MSRIGAGISSGARGGAPGEDCGRPTPREPERYDLSCTVDPYRSGWTLARFLSQRFRYHPPDLWAERIADGSVTLNGERAYADTCVTHGDRIAYSFLHLEPEVDTRYDVLHEDEHVLAVSKSGNLPVHAGGRYIRHTLVSTLARDGRAGLRLVHRLDRETSGVVLLAKSADVARRLETQFRSGVVEKRYLAVLSGAFGGERTIEAPIGRKAPRRPPYFHVVEAGGKAAVTTFRALGHASKAAGEVTAVAVSPRTGRTHQIRVHAAHAGHPIVGDKLYAVPEARARELVLLDDPELAETETGARRHLLHAVAIALPHPITGERLSITAPVPIDVTTFWGDSPPLPTDAAAG